MERREFITMLGGAAAAWPLAARGQQPAIPVIGCLGLTSADSAAYMLASFRKGLSEAGFDVGRDVTIDYRFADREVSRLPRLAAELVARKVTVVFTDTTVSALAMKAATSTIPIVFAIGADPRPGGNFTGVSFFTDQMEAVKSGLVASLNRAALLWNSARVLKTAATSKARMWESYTVGPRIKSIGCWS